MGPDAILLVFAWISRYRRLGTHTHALRAAWKVSPLARTPPQPPRHRRWASLLQAADYLAVSERTVRQMIYDGRLTGYRLGRTVRIDLNEVDDAMLPFGGN